MLAPTVTAATASAQRQPVDPAGPPEDPVVVVLGRLLDAEGAPRPGTVRAYRGVGEAREQVDADDVDELGGFELRFTDPRPVDLLAVVTGHPPERDPYGDFRLYEETRPPHTRSARRSCAVSSRVLRGSASSSCAARVPAWSAAAWSIARGTRWPTST